MMERKVNGVVNYYQVKNDKVNGYAIVTFNCGSIYYGEFRNSKIEGFGNFHDDDEYDG
jgi:hypothetical protein